MFGDGRLVHLPGGVDEYLARTAAAAGAPPPAAATPDSSASTDGRRSGPGTGAGEARAARKEVARLERALDRLAQQAAQVHAEMADHATDYAKITELDARLRSIDSERAETEDAWLAAAERAGDT
jgi:hypothetical protein